MNPLYIAFGVSLCCFIIGGVLGVYGGVKVTYWMMFDAVKKRLNDQEKVALLKLLVKADLLDVERMGLEFAELKGEG